MQVNQVNKQFKNIDFIVSSYNGFEIIVRKSDNYFNASKLIKNINKLEHTNKQIHHLLQNKTFIELVKEISKDKTNVIDIQKNLPNDLTGTYMDKLLLNYVCMWCSTKYLIKVNKIMDSINEQNTTVMNQLIEELQEENNKLKTQAIQDIGDNLENSKYVFIDQVDEDTFKIVYDKKQLKQQHYKTFEVLAAANIAKNSILKTFYTDGHKRTFKKENLNKVIELCKANGPIIELNQK